MGNSNITESRRTKRFTRFFRFRLRTLLLAFTAFGVFVGPEMHHQFRQHNAAKRLRAIPQTSLAYDYDLESDEHWTEKFPPIRSKVALAFRGATGSHFFNPVVRLFLSNDSLESIRLVGNLRNLKWLHIANSTGSMNDRKISTLKPIQNCSRLEYLVVGNWLVLSPNGSDGFRGTGTTLLPYDITDSDIDLISKLNDLRILAIGGQNVDDESIQKLINLNSLEYLYLSKADVTQDGLEEFQRARPNVEIVELTDSDIDYSIEIDERF